MKRQEGYIRKEVVGIFERSGIQMRASTVQHYTDRGVVTPEISNPGGKGTNRVYSKKNVLELSIARELIKRGLGLDTVVKAFEIVRERFKIADGRLVDFFDPGGPYMTAAVVYLYVYDHDDSSRFRVGAGWYLDLDKKMPDGFPENAMPQSLKKRYQPELDMRGHSSAIVLNVSELWTQIESEV
jgi:DNA-binding transcriptional MerR regulator